MGDKPDMNLSIASMDQGGQFEKIVKFWASMQQRNYVVMEVKGHLVKEEREALLKRLPSENFRKVAHVQIGEPDVDFKKRTQEITLQNKQSASDRDFKRQQ